MECFRIQDEFKGVAKSFIPGLKVIAAEQGRLFVVSNAAENSCNGFKGGHLVACRSASKGKADFGFSGKGTNKLRVLFK